MSRASSIMSAMITLNEQRSEKIVIENMCKWPEELNKKVQYWSYIWDATPNILVAPNHILSRMEMVVFSMDHKSFVIRPENNNFDILTGFQTACFKLHFNPVATNDEVLLVHDPDFAQVEALHGIPYQGPALVRHDYQWIGNPWD